MNIDFLGLNLFPIGTRTGLPGLTYDQPTRIRPVGDIDLQQAVVGIETPEGKGVLPPGYPRPEAIPGIPTYETRPIMATDINTWQYRQQMGLKALTFEEMAWRKSVESRDPGLVPVGDRPLPLEEITEPGGALAVGPVTQEPEQALLFLPPDDTTNGEKPNWLEYLPFVGIGLGVYRAFFQG